MAEILILIAEDELPIAQLVAELVRDLGATPLLASDGRQALAVARAQHPALLVTDLMMPHLSGVELIAALRADGLGPIPTILMTAVGLPAAQAAGADAVLAKPFDLDALEALVRRFVELPVA